MDLGTIIINVLNSLGFFNVIIPFMLIYSIVYGILLQTKIFGDPFEENTGKMTNRAKAVRSIISLVSASVAFLVVGSANVILDIRTVIPYIVLYILIIFMLILTVGTYFTLIAGNQDATKNLTSDYLKYLKIIVPISIVIFFILVLYGFGLLNFLSSNTNSAFSSFINLINANFSFIAAIIIFLIMIGFVYWMTKPPSEGKSGSTGQETKGQSGSSGGSSGTTK